MCQKSAKSAKPDDTTTNTTTDTTVATLDPHWPHWTHTGPTLNTGRSSPGPIPRGSTRVRTMPGTTITPGTPPPCTPPRVPTCHVRGPVSTLDTVHQASFGYSQGPTIPTCLKLSFYFSQKPDLSKTSFSSKSATKTS